MFRTRWLGEKRRSVRRRRPGLPLGVKRASLRRVPAIEPLEQRTVPSFLAPSNYLIGGGQIDAGPNSLVVGDFNGDGRDDLLTTNSQGVISVLFGNGDGTFQIPQTALFPWSLYDATTADLTGDGHLDLVAATELNTIAVLLGNGDGTFRNAGLYATGGLGPNTIAVGDLRGTGIVDLVVGNIGEAPLFSGSIAVLLGNGDGTFRLAQTIDVGPSSFPHPELADVNGDGKLDLIYTSGAAFGRVNICVGNGDGTFQPPVSYTVGSDPGGLAVGDLNHDGIPDLVVANSALLSGSPSLSVLLGNGDGTFQAAQQYAAGSHPVNVVLGDVNGDGTLDAAVADRGGDAINVLLGNGDGSFQAPRSDAVGARPEFIVADDFNGDGALDLATANGADISVRLNNGDGSFPTVPRYDPGTGPVQAIVTGDFTGDGIPDIAVASTTAVSVLVGNGDGSFRAPQITSISGSGSVSLAAGDFDGDGRVDLVVGFSGDFRNPGSLSVLLGNGDGTFRQRITYAGTVPPGLLAVGDLNGDGLPDVVVVGFSSPDSVTAFLSNGDGTFHTSPSYTLGSNPIAVAVADLAGDQRLDIVTANVSSTYTGSVSILLGNGDGSFQPPVSFALAQPPDSLAVGDFNNDGLPDLVLGSNWNGFYPGGITLLLGNGDGTFQPGVNSFGVTQVGPVMVTDFDQDGNLDLAAVLGGRLVVLLGNGDGTLAPPAFTYSGSIKSLSVADFNDDGWPDVALVDSSSNTISVLLNAADWAGGPRRIPPVRRPPASSLVDLGAAARGPAVALMPTLSTGEGHGMGAGWPVPAPRDRLESADPSEVGLDAGHPPTPPPAPSSARQEEHALRGALGQAGPWSWEPTWELPELFRDWTVGGLS